MDIKPLSKNRGKSREEVVNNLKRDGAFIKRHNQYVKNGVNYVVKENRDQYLRINAKDD
jgi:hypothetical protein